MEQELFLENQRHSVGCAAFRPGKAASFLSIVFVCFAAPNRASSSSRKHSSLTAPSATQGIYVSSDGRLLVIVSASGKSGKESRIVIRTSGGAQLFQKDFGSPDGEHGKSLVHASWTPDSKFFVWSMENSGGHSPWNWPSYIFDRRSKVCLSLDKTVGSITSPEFSLQAPNTLKGTKLNRKTYQNAPFTVTLTKIGR